jgi:hypothetical protein
LFIDASNLTNQKAALVIGHPGHELRVHRWLDLVKPAVFVLTDGSGRTGRSRLPSTTNVLADAGARPGRIYGRFTDTELYETIRRLEVTPLLRVMRELAEALSEPAVDYVVGDALEGFNPSHDLCRFLINGAASLIRKETGHELRNFDFLLDGSPEAFLSLGDSSEPVIRVSLDEHALQRKLAAAKGYFELRAETESALKRFGPQAFSTELLRPVVDWRQGLDQMEHEPPYYESFGEQQVRAGFYDAVIRYRAGVRPLVNSLWRQAGLECVLDATTETAASALIGHSSRSSHRTHS